MATVIKTDGVHTLGVGNGNERTLAASETFGGATVTPGYINVRGNFVGFKDGSEVLLAFTASFQIVQSGGIGIKYAVSVSGATGTTDIQIEEFRHGR